jgi:ParB family transcriptional regulator, chromosome partitioning protein
MSAVVSFPAPPPRGGGRRRTTLPHDPFEALSSPPRPAEGEELGRVPLSAIVPSPANPRRQFSPEAVEELANSIAQQGLQQPLQLRPSPHEAGRFEIVAGERRFRALRLLVERQKLPADFRVPALLCSGLDDRAMLLRALVENLQRQDLHPLDEAAAFERLRTSFALTTEEIGSQLGKSQRWVQLRLSLLELDGDVKAAFLAGDVQLAHARALAGEPRPKQRAALGELLARPAAERTVEVIRAALQPAPKALKLAALPGEAPSPPPSPAPVRERRIEPRQREPEPKPRLTDDEVVSALGRQPLPAIRLALARLLGESEGLDIDLPRPAALLTQLRAQLGPQQPSATAYHGLLVGLPAADVLTLFAARMLGEALRLGQRSALIEEILEVSK